VKSQLHLPGLPAWFTSERTFAWRVFLAALLLRLLPVLLAREMGIGLDDMFQYDMLARSLAAGEGYRWYAEEDLKLVQAYLPVEFSMEGYDPRGVPTSFRPPLYPAFLALVYWLTGAGPGRFLAVRLTQALLAALLAPLTWALARRFFPGQPPAARLAAWTVACYPMLVVYPLSLATENLFFVLIYSALLALLTGAETRRMPAFLLAGLLLGLAGLTRSVSLAFSGLAVLWLWFVLRERKAAALVFLLVSLVTLPWMVRNSLLHGRPTGVESALGYDLYVGYHPESSGTFQYGISLDLIPLLDDGERDRIGTDQALAFIREDPGRVPYLVVRRLGYFFGLERRALTYFYSNNYFGYIPPGPLFAAALLLMAPFVLVSTSAAFGLTLARWNRSTVLLALLFIGYITPHALILGEDRFHLTLVPALAVLAAGCWSQGMPALRARWAAPGGRRALTLAAAAVLLLFLNWGLELWREADKLALLFGPDGNLARFPY
jgi:hypothetical protein